MYYLSFQNFTNFVTIATIPGFFREIATALLGHKFPFQLEECLPFPSDTEDFDTKDSGYDAKSSDVKVCKFPVYIWLT